MDGMAAQNLKKLPEMLEAIDVDASRVHHLTQAALHVLDELPYVNAEGKRIAAMDQLWAVLSSLETLTQLLSDGLGDAVMQAKHDAA